MDEGVISTIGEMLEHHPELASNAFIFTQSGQLRHDSLALVDRQGLYDPDYVPELAKVNGLNYLMMTDAYNDVAINIRMQIEKPPLVRNLKH